MQTSSQRLRTTPHFLPRSAHTLLEDLRHTCQRSSRARRRAQLPTWTARCIKNHTALLATRFQTVLHTRAKHPLFGPSKTRPEFLQSFPAEQQAPPYPERLVSSNVRRTCVPFTMQFSVCSPSNMFFRSCSTHSCL